MLVNCKSTSLLKSSSAVWRVDSYTIFRLSLSWSLDLLLWASNKESISDVLDIEKDASDKFSCSLTLSSFFCILLLDLSIKELLWEPISLEFKEFIFFSDFSLSKLILLIFIIILKI